MNKSNIKALLFYSFLIIFSNKSFASVNFTFGDEDKLKNMHVELSGETEKGLKWKAVPMTDKDIPFFASCYADGKTMTHFAGGVLEEKAATDRAEARIKGWQQRFYNGNPHGGLIVLSDQGKQIGHLVAGGGDAPGVSEVARILRPDVWGQGLGTSLMQTVVKIWAPEVRKRGLDESNPAVAEKFKCFGGEALYRLDATSSPSNVGSWKSQDKAGFLAAEFKVDSPKGEYIINLDGKEYQVQKGEQYQAMEEELLKLFNALFTEKPLKEGQRFRMVDIDGVERTFSKHQRFDTIKYHAEYQLN